MKISKKLKLFLEVVVAMAIVSTLGWEMLKTGAIGQQPVEVRICVLVFCIVMTLVWAVHCLTPDKTTIKPKWW